MAKRENDLGRDPIGKLLLRLAVPTVTAQLVNALYNIVDRIYIGHIPGEGDLALTGLGICFPVILFVSAISALVGMGGGSRAVVRMGEGKLDEANKILGNCTLLPPPWYSSSARRPCSTSSALRRTPSVTPWTI